MAAMAPSTAAAPPSTFDAWLLQKLRLDWSSPEFGGLLSPSKLSEARASFPHLETPIKVRVLLSLLSASEADVAQKEVDALLELATKDTEEWVRVSAGIVTQFLVLQRDGQPADSYLHSQLDATANKVVQLIASHKSQVAQFEDFFSLENGLLNAALRPQVAPTTAIHFTVSGEDDDVDGKEDDASASPVKKLLHRPQMARPSGIVGASATAGVSATRLTQTTAKPPVGKKKNLTELSSEIRRKADAGRFKRQRSRISMIDINEVKQIESEKAQKAEERKKQKLAAKEKEKEKAKEKEKEKSSAAAVSGAVVGAGDKSGTVESFATPIAVNDEHAAIAADIFAMHQQPGPDESVQQYSQQPLPVESTLEQVESIQGNGADDYVPDGTAALLNAAFHSTQDIMKEVVSQQSHHMQSHQQQIQHQLQPPVYQDLFRTQQQMQMHHLVPPQPQYQAFEPDDTTMNNNVAAGVPMAFGGYSYGSTAGYYGDQFGNYGTAQDPNAFASAGYPNSAMGQPDNGMGLPPLGGRHLAFDNTQQQQQQQQLQQQQQQQLQQQQHQHQQHNNGGYMGGPEYWR